MVSLPVCNDVSYFFNIWGGKKNILASAEMNKPKCLTHVTHGMSGVSLATYDLFVLGARHCKEIPFKCWALQRSETSHKRLEIYDNGATTPSLGAY